MDQFQVVRELAPALFGCILLCVNKSNGQHVAVKRMQLAAAAKHQSNEGPTVQEDVHVEKRVYRHVDKVGGHRNILRLLTSFEEDGHEHFVLEYCVRGDLFTMVQEAPHQHLPASQVLHYAHQICHGLSFLHSHGIAHGDISLENVLVDAHGVAKLMDFGLAVESFHGMQSSSAVGKFFYMPPEMYMGAPYDASKADMWSLGILLVILHTGMPPFARAHSSGPFLRSVISVLMHDDRSCSVDHVFASFQRHGIRALLRGWNVLPRFSMDAVDLVEKLLVMIPATRLSVAQVLRHPYLTPPQHHPVPKHAMMGTPEHAGSSCHSKMEHKTRSSGGVHRFFQRVFRKAVGSTNQSTLCGTLHDDSSERTLCNDTPTSNNQMCT
ncbi:serine/threonine protein kinase [Aphanomyces astaci]|uniref:Serine/threonine protein kinase n=1 Tax=Aphanomyces astaci TaxID=112090 RepID=W4FS70_APHAT|nr:serine/threonine protein kinase [Aphanomyces astaci]ETV69669.1 serine/threonine protein kinase [Aphanomyces astaci]|eukprot:XP_009840885.1 serine/threonine protein kinase [Aphanomyces astaci]